jgi:uncharacterized OB-fold protein
MSHDSGPNVVAAWRGRALTLARQAWACASCGRLTLARRRVCLACGSAGGTRPAPLPRRGTAVALCPAGAAVEHLDQVTTRRAALLVELDGGAVPSRIACLLAHADSVSLMSQLRGEPVRLTVRRIPLSLPPDAPIPYGLKASVDLDTRARLRARSADNQE